MLTKGAIGNLVNKYRAVLKKCGLLNVFGSLAVVGALVPGGAGLAAAAANWNDNEVVISGPETYTATNHKTSPTDVGGQNAQYLEAKKVIIRGGSLTISDGGRLTHYVYSGNPVFQGMDFRMESGSLNIDGSQGLATVDANTVTINGGTLTLTGKSNTAASAYIGGYKGMIVNDGAIVMNDNSQLFGGSVIGAQFKGGTVTMNGSSGKAAHIQFGGMGANSIEGNAVINVTGYGLITTGDNVNMAGGALNIAEAGNLTLGNGTDVAKLTQNGGTVTNAGKLVLAQNSTMAVIDGGTLAVADSGKITTTASSALNFNSGSLFNVSARSAGDGTGVIQGNGSVTVNDGAKLRISGAKANQQYTVTKGVTVTQTGNQDGWSGDNLLSSTSFLGFSFDATTGEVTTRAKSAAEALPTLDGELGRLAVGMYAAGRNDYFTAERGRRFLSRATDNNYITDAKQAAVTIESAARMALVGAVPQMTMAASNAAGNVVTQRTSLAQPGGNAIQSMAMDGSVSGASAGDASKTGFAMWIMPLYQSSNGWGLEGGGFNLDYSGGLGGVAIGADYTFDNAIRAGITFNIGGGYATGSGDFNETTNNMNFWGLGAYLGWAQNNFGVTADVNYTSTYNKLEQDLPAGMRMGKLKSDVTAYAISAGLRGEYKLETQYLDIIPHVGVRYMSLNTDEYDVKSGGTLLKGDGISQNIWTFPVGVAFSKQIATGNGWHVKPCLDLAVIPASGDIKARSDVRFTGVNGTAELDTQTMDYISYMGQAGLEFGNDNVSFGVNYNVQAGAHSTAHGVFGTFRYEF